MTNRHLERHGIDARVDHRSLKEQGIEREPTVQVGYAGMEIDALGGDSDRMNALKGIMERNDIWAELTKLEQDLKALTNAGHQRLLQEPVARAYGDGARPAVADVRQDWRDETFLAHQAAWRQSVADQHPDRARPVTQALTVVDGATGAVSKLGDFMLDLLAGPAPQPAKAARPSTNEFLSNAAARAAHQRAGYAAAREAGAGGPGSVANRQGYGGQPHSAHGRYPLTDARVSGSDLAARRRRGSAAGR